MSITWCQWVLGLLLISVSSCSSSPPGVGKAQRWTVFLAVNWWTGCSRLVWLRTAVRQFFTGRSYSKAVSSSTLVRNTASKTGAFITASSHDTLTRKDKRQQRFTLKSKQSVTLLHYCLVCTNMFLFGPSQDSSSEYLTELQVFNLLAKREVYYLMKVYFNSEVVTVL